jgi:DNA modification methylase
MTMNKGKPMRYTLHCGDNRQVLKTMPDNSVDSIVCDPPYELGFMGKRWDSTGIAYDVTLWTECLRVLKPGGHLIAFGGTRTYHRMTCAIEDAGFEIRDCIQWIYGSGFPKSHNVANAIDKSMGHENRGHAIASGSKFHATTGLPRASGELLPKYEGKSETSKPWEGYGTALKPACEPAVLARKPLTGTVADNVMTWGVGALNIDGCRVGDAGGRWPANVIFDEAAAKVLDEQSGVSKSTVRPPTGKGILDTTTGWNQNSMIDKTLRGHSDSGGASRFFYVAKASKAEREAGLDGMELKIKHTQMRSANGTGEKNFEGGFTDSIRANHHPTVKPIDLMRYLVRLVTPKGGTVLDPFMGSGSTGCAAMLEGMDFVGIDITPEYVEIARNRILHHANQNPMGL